MLAEENDPIFYTFGAEVYPRCSQCGLPMHMTEHRPSSLLGNAYETQRFACECKFEMVRDADCESKH
jgi:hypothetical protein